MKIDWFTVIAQVLNFLILVWLLKRFLYKPVLNAIGAREKRIAAQLNDAAEKEANALSEKNLFQQKNAEFEQQRAAALTQVEEEAKAERQKQFAQVRNDSAALQQKLQQAIAEQQQNISAGIKNKIQQEVFAIAARTLNDLGSASLEEQIMNAFIRRINNFNEDERKQFKEAFDTLGETLHVTTAFPLSASQKNILQKAITTITGNDISFDYLLNKAIISGIEIAVKSYRLAWNIENYLDELKKHIGSSFNNTKMEENVAE